ncbi:MAG: hypothetical protein RR728_00480, partial [Oscillospiraceae bacterium]
MKRKIISLILSLVLIISILPVGALAQGESAFTGETFILTGPPESLTESPYANKWNVTVGEYGASFGVRFKETGVAVPAANISWDNASLPAGISVSGGGTDYINVSVAKTVSAGNHTVSFIVNGATASILISVASSSGGTGGDPNAFAGQTFIVFGDKEQPTNMYGCPAGTNTSFGVRFKENNQYVTAIVAPSSLPKGVGVSINGNTATVTTDGTTPSGLYSMIFSVNGKNATVQLSINSGDGGNPPPPPARPTLECATDVATPNWKEVPMGSGVQPTMLKKDEYLYYRITQNGSIIPTSAITPAVNNIAGEAAIDSVNSTNEYIAVKGGSKNGYVSISFPYSYNGSNGGVSARIMITGNVIVPDAESGYKTATIKQSFANSGSVTFENVSGVLTAEDTQKGFALNGGTLSFDTTSKAAGIYDAALNGKKYTVAVMNTIPSSNIPTRTVTMSNAAPTSLKSGSGDDIYVWNGKQDGAPANQVPFFDNQSGETVPIYLYRKAGGKLVSMDGYTFTLTNQYMDISPFVSFDTVVVNGITVVRLSLTDKAVRASTILGFININDEKGNFVKSVEFTKTSGPMQGAYAFTTVPTSVSEGSMRAFYNNNVTMFVGGGYFGDPKDIGDPTKVYLTKKSGDPVKYDFALYDEIDISTFNVQSSNNAFIKVKGFLEKTPSGENAIGYELEIVDNTKVQAAEILVSFKDTKGTQYNYYGGITCVGKPAPAGECVVSNVTEFKSAYNRLTSGKIIMKAGTYSMDLLHNRNISIVAEKSATVTINGENETNTNAIITLGLSNSAPISGIIIDGRNKKRDGIDPNGFNGYAMGVTVQDCKVGLRQTTFSWALIVSDAVFKNNTTAIDAMAGRIDIRTSTFENNGVAINYAAPNPTECRTHLNKFVNNTTDFYVNTDCNNIVSTQNYFQGQSAVRKPVIQTASGKIAKVYYSPYYINSEMTILSADIAGAKTEGKRAITKSLTIPVDRTLNSASVFDSNIFKEMKQTGNEGTEISIPVTELTDVANKKTKITTIWGFNNETGNLAETLPQTMNLEVKNTLSPSAQDIIDKSTANKGEIVQCVNFTHDGSLPGYATVKVLKTNSITKEYLQLYYINKTTGKVEQAKIVDVYEQTIDGEVYYIVTVDHCSEYIIATANVFTVDDSSGSNSGSTTPDNSTQDTPAPAPAPTAKPTIAKAP